MLRVLAVNWRTTSAGLVALSILIGELSKAIDGNDNTSVSWELVTMNAAIVWGMFSARDSNVTSERAGAK